MLPFLIGLSAFIFQVDDVTWIMATHFSTVVLDYTVLVVTTKQFQATLLYSLHLKQCEACKIAHMAASLLYSKFKYKYMRARKCISIERKVFDQF